MMGTHVYLRSDDRASVFHDQKLSKFTNELAQPLHFSEDQCVCLKGIEYSNIFENFNKTHDRITIFDFSKAWPPNSPPNPTDSVKYGAFLNIGPRSGFYDDINVFLARVNAKVRSAKIKGLKGKNLFMYDPPTRKISVNIDKLNISLLIRGNSIPLLGLTSLHDLNQDEVVILGKSKLKSYYLADDGSKRFFLPSDKKRWKSQSPHGGLAPFEVNLDVNAIINVYTDILQSFTFGSKYCKLLKKINSSSVGKIGQRIYKEFSHLTYLPINTQDVHLINVELKTQHGNLIKWLSGPIILFLHFKPQRLIM